MDKELLTEIEYSLDFAMLAGREYFIRTGKFRTNKNLDGDMVLSGYGKNRIAREVVAKLKALGYEQVWEECPECGGEKVAYINDLSDATIGTKLCPTCNGTGKVRIQFKLPEGIEEWIAILTKNWWANPDISYDELAEEEKQIFRNFVKRILSLIRQDKE